MIEVEFIISSGSWRVKMKHTVALEFFFHFGCKPLSNQENIRVTSQVLFHCTGPQFSLHRLN